MRWSNYKGLRGMEEGKNLAADLGKAVHFFGIGVLEELGNAAFIEDPIKYKN
jgi:hypothetical protein